jgi:hypothetical protein
MKVFYVLTLVVGTICLCAVQGGKGTFPSSTGPHVTAKGYPLACNVSVKNSTWDKNSPVEVSIVIENRSSNTLNMRIVPSLSLTASDVAEEPQRSELSYVALMNLPGAGAGSVAMSRTVPLRLNGHAREEVTWDIAKLLWKRLNWSVLAHSTLFEAVPAGKYQLQFTITASNGRDVCSSNALPVEMK